MDDLLLLTTSHGENVSILFADADGGGLHIETELARRPNQKPSNMKEGDLAF